VTSTVAEIAERIQRSHLAHFRACLSQLEARGHVEPESEAVEQHGIAVTEGALATPYRHDAALLLAGAPELFTFDSAQLSEFEPILATWATATVRVEPFFWDSCELRFQPPRDPRSLAPLQSWFLRAFRDRAEPVNGVVGAVHFISDPTTLDGTTRVTLDLGTAPSNAFLELLDALQACGILRILVTASSAA
jgi:hypothetical protein